MKIEYMKVTYGECERFDDVPDGATIECVDDRPVVGRCETCRAVLFEDADNYHSDHDGVLWCKKHEEGER